MFSFFLELIFSFFIVIKNIIYAISIAQKTEDSLAITVAWVSEEKFRKVSASRPSFDLFFTERPNLEDTSPSSSSMRSGEDQIVNRESPVLHTGRPNKSNKSCNRGFFTSESTSQSLLKAGLKFTWNLLNCLSNSIILFCSFELLYFIYL